MKMNQIETTQHLKQLINHIDSGPELDTQATKQALETLETYECWSPFFRLLKKKLKNAKTATIDYYLSLTKVQVQYLEDVLEAGETSAQAVKKLELTFQQWTENYLPFVIEEDDWKTESVLLETAVDHFKDRREQIQAMERLCLLYEKKVFNEPKLNSSYKKLLNLDSLNIKALRYFKLIYSQNNNWEEVASVLESLIKASKHPQDIFRVAQELAAVRLYQLDEPKTAIDLLDKFCKESPLDSSTIKFDAFQRLGDWNGCLQVLKDCLLFIDNPETRSIIYYRMALIEEKLRNTTQAIKLYEKTIGSSPKFLEAYENMAYIYIQQKDWKNLLRCLDMLNDQLDDEQYKTQVSDAKSRISEGISSDQHA